MKRLIQSAETVPDKRQSLGNLQHKLSDLLVIAFCAIICEAQTYRDFLCFVPCFELPVKATDKITGNNVLEALNVDVFRPLKGEIADAL